MAFTVTISVLCVLLLSGVTLATPAVDVQELEARQAVDNIVYVTDSNLFWCVQYCGSPKFLKSIFNLTV